jgi:predicted ATPase/DNA-binding winged helix-turn-helix (wHTH) protein
MEAAPLPEPPEFRFGRFRLDPTRRVLLEEGVPVKLGSRAVDLLLLLVQHRSRVVSKDEIFDRVWPRLVVEDNNLQQHISALRKMLGPQAIITVPGRGYQFAQRMNAADTPLAVTASPTPLRSLVLPPDPGTLFGRETDLAEVRSRVAQHALVTLVGPGGIGKTRLAWAAARAELGQGIGDVAWVDLSVLNDGVHVPTAVAQALDVVVPDQAAAGAVSAAVAAALRGRRMLLLLDNCEHLVDGVSAFVESLHGLAPEVHVLATSQEPLRLGREQVIRLQTLAESAAVRLFLTRASAADRHFVADERAQVQASDICSRLEGIPLAIELAAARMPLLGLSGLQEQLHEGLRVLASGSARAPARQRTLLAALAWSHGLLGAAERDLFRRVAVFSGGFSPKLAQRVLSDDDTDPWQVLDRIGDLVDKSLLIADTQTWPRCRLLEPVREFALEKLHQAGEVPALRLRHAGAMVDLLRQFDHAVIYEPNFDALARPVMAEVDNLRAAMKWLAGLDGSSGGELPPSQEEARLLAIGLAAHVHWLPSDADAYGDIFRFCGLVRGWLDETTPDELAARVLLSLHSQPRARSLPAAQRLTDIRAAVNGFRATGDREGLYRALCALSRLDQRNAGGLLAEAEALEDPSWSARMRMRRQVALEWWHDVGGRLEDSRQAGRRCLALARIAGSVRSVIGSLGNVADTEFALGNVDEAIALCREAVALAKHHAVPAAARHVYPNMVPALLARDELDAAEHAIREGRDLMIRSQGSARDLLLPTALLAWRRGQTEAAARLVGCADRVYGGLGEEPHPPERRMRENVLEGLQSALPADVLTALRQAGAACSEDEGFAQAGI